MKKKFFIFTFLLLSFFSVTKKINAIGYNVGRVTTNGSSLNIRSENSTSSSILTKVNNNTYLTIISETSNMYKVEYGKNKYGYASKTYITGISSTKKTVNVSSALNVRAAPNGSIIDKLYNGTNVYVLSTNNGWSKIVYNGGKTGYVSSSFLKSSTMLKVISYKQFDTRWASVEIVSGKTIKQIGCTTTSLAMTESYRTKTAITPVDMKNKSKYTTGGSIYWPSNYTFYTGSNYIAKIKELIDQGKPVIVGSYNSNNKTHFVVAYGYDNNNIYINDPGSSYRTTLNEFFSAYPRFYKLAYY